MGTGGYSWVITGYLVRGRQLLFVDMLKKQDMTLVAGFTFTGELARSYPAVENFSWIQLISSSCPTFCTSLPMFGSLDLTASITKQMSDFVILKDTIGCFWNFSWWSMIFAMAFE